jgi:hypothetical protein
MEFQAPHAQSPRSPRRRPVLVSARDRLLLEMAGEHRLILPAHAQTLLEVSYSAAISRLRRLSTGGYLSPRRVFTAAPTSYQITRNGLAVIQSRLPRPQLDLRAYAHDVGVAWLWLAARGGAFGPLGQVVSERTMRSRDGRRDPGSTIEPFGVRLGGAGPRGRERLHYPDLLLIMPEGHRVAVELELSAKGSARREKILAGYGGDPRIDAVLYLVEQPSLARAIQTSARRLGISHLVHVQWVRQPAGSETGLGRDAQRPAISRSVVPNTPGRER